LRGRSLLGLAGLLLFTVLLQRLGIRRSLEALLAADRPLLFLSIGGFFLSQALRLAKWTYLLRRAEGAWAPLATAHFYFHIKLLGTLTPGRLGEFLPALASGGGRGALLSITTYDRLLESSTTLLFGLTAFAFLLRSSAPAAFLPVSLALLAAISLGAFLCWRNSWMTGIGERIERRAAGGGGHGPIGRLLAPGLRIAGGIRDMQESFRALFRGRVVATSLALTIAAVAADLLFWWTTFLCLGIRLSPGRLVASVALFNVTGFFSPTPGGLGVSDAAFVVFLRSTGVEGPFGSFLILLRLIVAVFTAIPAWLLSALLRYRKR